MVNNTSVTLAGNSEFTHNHCESDLCLGGNGITVLNSNLTFTGSTTFLENNATFYGLFDWHGGGGAIYALSSTVLSFTGTNNFVNNLVLLAGGNQLAVGYTSVSIAFVTLIVIIVFQLEKWQQKQLQIDIKL